MVKEILTGAGFEENKTFKETRFLKPPKSTYSIFMDSYKGRGADDLNLIKEHTYTIELYAYKADPEAEKRIEAELNKRGIQFDKLTRQWLETEQLYMTVYTFNFIEK